jgi:hypothetical protein
MTCYNYNMKKLALSISSIILPTLLLVPKVHADVVNNVQSNVSSGNGGSATSNVSINNSGGTNSTSSYTTGGSTNIHVETNGQSYNYHSDTPSSVNVQSVNGKVTVNGVEKTTTPVTPGTGMSASDTAKAAQEKMEEMKKKAASDEATIRKHTEDMRKQQENFIQKLIDALKNFFHF